MTLKGLSTLYYRYVYFAHRQIHKLTETNINLEECIGDPDVSFEGRPAGEVSCPEGVITRGIGEEVVMLDRVRLIGLVQGIQVTGGRRVEQVNIATVQHLLSGGGGKTTGIMVFEKLLSTFI